MYFHCYKHYFYLHFLMARWKWGTVSTGFTAQKRICAIASFHHGVFGKLYCCRRLLLCSCQSSCSKMTLIAVCFHLGRLWMLLACPVPLEAIPPQYKLQRINCFAVLRMLMPCQVIHCCRFLMWPALITESIGLSVQVAAILRVQTDIFCLPKKKVYFRALLQLWRKLNIDPLPQVSLCISLPLYMGSSFIKVSTG